MGTSGKHRKTPEQIREQYEIEKELAKRLLNSSKEERQRLYTTLYDELYTRIPHHLQLTRMMDPEALKEAVAIKMRLLRHFIKPDAVFLEVGAGDCRLALEVARYVKKVYAIDMSEVLTESTEIPDNFELLISDGSSIPVPPNSVNIAYSHQLMEHLHPDDVLDHIKNIQKALVPDGVYICITPNRLKGPHDISKYFDKVATGFHLKEYTNTEVAKLLRNGGFSKVRICSGAMMTSRPFLLHVFPVMLIESLLGTLPHSLCRGLARLPVISPLLGIKVAATK